MPVDMFICKLCEVHRRICTRKLEVNGIAICHGCAVDVHTAWANECAWKPPRYTQRLLTEPGGGAYCG